MPKDDAEQFFSAIVGGDAETVRARTQWIWAEV